VRIKSDLLQIRSDARHADGTKAEPEEQPAARIIETDASVTHGTTPTNQTMRTQIVAESTAGQLANSLSHSCGQCKWFDNRGFQEAIRKSDHPAAPLEARQAVNDIRAALLMTGNATMESKHIGMDGDTDVEAMLMACGFCKALTEHYKEDVIVYPLSSCPEEVRTPTQPNGYFQPANRGAVKAGNLVRDDILKRASGKVK
jgi:hypothetical protein